MDVCVDGMISPSNGCQEYAFFSYSGRNSHLPRDCRAREKTLANA